MTKTHLINDRWQDNLSDVHPKLRLPLEAALGVEQQVLGEPRPILSEALVERVIAHGAEPVTGAVDEIVKVTLVLVVVELTSRIAQAVRLVVAVWLKDVAWLEKYLCFYQRRTIVKFCTVRQNN